MTGLAVKSRRFRYGRGEGELKGGVEARETARVKRAKTQAEGRGYMLALFPRDDGLLIYEFEKLKTRYPA